MNELNLSSRAWFLWNNSWRREVFGENGAGVGREADTPMEVASLTKIMTAIVVLERRDLDEEVVITEEMLAGLEEFAVIGLTAGQVATVEDLLYATMLPSAGDAAQALAISTSGSIEEFVRLMNQQAASLGMKNTHFSNPVGFDWWISAEGTDGGSGESSETGAGEGDGKESGTDGGEIRNYSTVRDVAMMLRWALQDERFREIFESYEKELPSIGKVARKTFRASGASGAAVAPGTGMIKGGKTGFTNAAGRCLASTAEIEGTEYILVTLGAPAEGTGHLEDAAKVYAAVEAEYEPVRLVAAGDVLVRVPVEGSAVKALEFRAGQDFVAALPNGFRTEDLEYSFEGYEGQTAVRRDTVAGEPFGWWKIEYDGSTLYKKELVAQSSCESIENCVEMPEFYNYGWVALGAGLTVILAGLTIWGFWKSRRSGRKSKLAKAGPWIGLAITATLAAVCGLVFWSWFAPAGEVEVLRTEATRVETEENPIDNEEAPEEKAEETGAASGSSAGSTGSAGLAGGNCTTGFGNLMLINPNFTVGTEFITGRRGQLISVSQTYGIQEYHAAGNGDNLMIPEAAEHLNEMLTAYQAENPGHEMGTYSCFRARGTTCGRLCAATGASDHHTGLTCDLIDLQYGSVLNTDDYPVHLEWQWLRANSYKYGFIDRFPEEWAGGSMAEPLNVDANGSTGLFETWHYRYVGVTAATEIATGKYNNGRYDSLEHYLKAMGRVRDLKGGVCE